jgi:single-strand DNA-binding protein
MSGLNKVMLIGRLGKDPETRSFDSGHSVTSFSMATSEKYKDRTSGEQKEITEWHNIVMWGSLGEIAQKYLKKGSQVYVEGKLRTRSWEKENVTRYTTEVVCDSMTMLGDKSSSSSSASSSARTAPAHTPEDGKGRGPAKTADESSDDLPF